MPAPATDFRIASVETFHVANPQGTYWEGYKADNTLDAGRYQFKPGWRTVYARIMESPLLKVTLADGTVGWGEATAPITPEVVCLVAERLVAPLVQGRDWGHPLEAWDFLYDAHKARGYTAGYYLDAAAALDIAVWDALGKRAGLPVAALLAEAPRRHLPVYLSGIRRATLAERVDWLNQWRDTGLDGAKLFVDGDLPATLAEIEGLQAGSPGLGCWMVDSLWMHSEASATEAKQALHERDVFWLECPLVPEDLPAHVRLTQQPGTRIALGEHFRSHHQCAPWFEAGALDVYQPDIGRTGFSDGLRQRDLAAARGIPTTPHMGAGFTLVQAAALHYAAACPPGLLCEYQAGHSDKIARAAHTAWQYADGAFTLPDAPGLGVTIDEDALAALVVTDAMRGRIAEQDGR